LKKGHLGIAAQFNTIQVINNPILEVHHDLQIVLTKHQQAFETLKGLPLSWAENDHSILLLLGSQPPNVCPYRYPFSQHNEIEKIIQEILEASTIHWIH
jgi:hypothetical protein